MTAPDETRSLDYWKRPCAGPDEAARCAADLVRAGIARHGPGLAPDLSGAAADPDAALRLSRRAADLGLGDDEARSWVWVSACLGNLFAAAEIGAILVAEGAAPAAAGRADLRRLGAEWFSFRDARAAALPGAVPGDPIAAAEAVERAAAEAAGGAAAPAVGASPGVPIPAVGDPGSREGRDLLRRYGAVVARALPLRGELPGAGVIRGEILARWPWAAVAAEAVESRLSVLRLAGGGMRRLPALLLVGPEGSGKSSLAEWLPRRLGMHVLPVPCAAPGAGGLAAVARSWPGARPGAVAAAMLDGLCRNPVLVLARIDAADAGVARALAELVGADRHRDPCLLAAVDLTEVSFVATARSAAAVPPALRGRFEAVAVPRPGRADLPALHANALSDFRAGNGLAPGDLPALPPRALALVERGFRRGDRSARAYARRLGVALAAEIERAEGERAAGAAARERAIRAAEAATPPDGPPH